MLFNWAIHNTFGLLKLDYVFFKPDCGGPEEFLCNNSRCIRITQTCDTADDCGDSSDEDGCVTYPGKLSFKYAWCFCQRALKVDKIVK